jgi:hypothetical protein
MQKKINSFHDSENVDNMTFADFIRDVLETTEEEYIKMIRSNLNGPKVFLQRKTSEVRVTHKSSFPRFTQTSLFKGR